MSKRTSEGQPQRHRMAVHLTELQRSFINAEAEKAYRTPQAQLQLLVDTAIQQAEGGHAALAEVYSADAQEEK